MGTLDGKGLQAPFCAPGQVDPQIGLGVHPGVAFVPGQVGGSRRPKAVPTDDCRMGRGRHELIKRRHALTLRPPSTPDQSPTGTNHPARGMRVHRRRSPINPAVISIQVDVAAADDSDDVTADETVTVFQDGSDAEGG
jgi:hypothetical protein